MEKLKIGQKIYVETQLHISRGSDDVIGGLATIIEIKESISMGEKCQYVTVKEHPGICYNWDHHLSKKQEMLKERFGEQVAYPDPDIDTPWIENGDLVDGKVYQGRPIW